MDFTRLTAFVDELQLIQKEAAVHTRLLPHQQRKFKDTSGKSW